MTKGTSPGGLGIKPLDRYGTAIDAFAVDCIAAEECRENQDGRDGKNLLLFHSAAPLVRREKSLCAM
jgi:hypothetical protein